MLLLSEIKREDELKREGNFLFAKWARGQGSQNHSELKEESKDEMIVKDGVALFHLGLEMASEKRKKRGKEMTRGGGRQGWGVCAD